MLLKQVKIMEDHGPWKFTEEQIIKIKQFDSESINKFYFDNLELVKSIIRKYIYLHGWQKYITFDDCIQQFYIDIPLYNYSSRKILYNCIIFGTIKYCDCGGYFRRNRKIIQCLSLDGVLYEDNDNDFYNFIGIEHDFYEAEHYSSFIEKGREIIKFLETTIKNPKDLNLMFCTLFTDLKQKDIKGNEYEEFRKCFA